MPRPGTAYGLLSPDPSLSVNIVTAVRLREGEGEDKRPCVRHVQGRRYKQHRVCVVSFLAGLTDYFSVLSSTV